VDTLVEFTASPPQITTIVNVTFTVTVTVTLPNSLR
jgi:hypothetical protein